MSRERFAALVVVGFGCALCVAQTPSVTDQKSREVLREALGQGPAPKPTNAVRPQVASTNIVKQPTLAETERLYLEGKITARDFQRFLQTYRPEPARPKPAALPTNDVHSRALDLLRKTTPNMAANPEGPAITEPLPEPPPPEGATNQAAKAAALQDVESKINELMQKKEAREQATNTSTTATNASGTQMTKRQKLDHALKLYIDGKLSDGEYKERRAKILAEPD
ncbi:MAG: hypothetical protein L0Y58_16920 [Verrucomicrobia subdivision 3 bacterium]|nr:hypothetical protein [Limisphaerales bacterium]